MKSATLTKDRYGVVRLTLAAASSYIPHVPHVDEESALKAIGRFMPSASLTWRIADPEAGEQPK